jgi:HlyD family secretion protein
MKLSPRTRRITQAATLAAVLAVIVIAMLPGALEVDISSVERGPLEVVLRHEGKTRVCERYTITAPVAGRVERIDMEPGDRVRAGETVVATFTPASPTPLDTRTRRQNEASVEAAEAEVERMEAEVAQAEQERAYSESERKRYERLFDDGIASESRLEEVRTTARGAREALEAARAALRAARFELETARAALIPPDAASSGETFQIRAPVDGVVLQRWQESEATMAQGTRLLEIADTSRLEVVADFLSTDAVQFRPGMRAVIDGWGGEKTLAATVRRVEPYGFMKISALGVEEQRVNVILDFDDPYRAWKALGDGYRVQVGVVVWDDDDVLRVPASALFRDQTHWATYKVVSGDAQLTHVEIGHQSGLYAEVLSGLEAGDRVIEHPSDEVSEDASVEQREL